MLLTLRRVGVRVVLYLQQLLRDFFAGHLGRQFLEPTKGGRVAENYIRKARLAFLFLSTSPSFRNGSTTRRPLFWRALRVVHLILRWRLSRGRELRSCLRFAETVEGVCSLSKRVIILSRSLLRAGEAVG